MANQIEQKDILKHLKKAKTLMLTTDSDEGLRARPMSLVQDFYDGELYFFTNADSRKVEEIEDEHKVCVSGTNASDKAYFSLTGRATLTRDEKLIDKFWNPVVASWFPEGKEDRSCALLKVRVESVDVWESESNPLFFWYEVFKAKIVDKMPDVGELKHRDEQGSHAPN